MPRLVTAGDELGPASAHQRRHSGYGDGVVVLLSACIEAPLRHDNPSCRCRRIEPSNAIDLLATIRERQGRVEEAVALLHTRDSTSVNNRDQLADLLARDPQGPPRP